MRKQLSLVSFYGAKPRQLIELIDAAQHAVSVCLPTFRPYSTGQVHATIIRLEADQAAARHNANFLQHRGKTRDMDTGGMIASLRHSPCLPMMIRVGGFQSDTVPFTSRGLSPFDRTFSIQGNKAVMMGWPTRAVEGALDAQQHEGLYPQSLELLRRSAQPFGILHAWHRLPHDIENDFYMRLGLFDAPPTRAEIESVSEALRPLLDTCQILDCLLDDLHLVAYRDESLPLSATRACRVTDPHIGGFISTHAGVA